jgi:hypothetical protein
MRERCCLRQPPQPASSGDGCMSGRKKFKIQRSLGIELPGLGKAGALEKRNFPAARQVVSHEHVLVNGRRQTIGSMVLRVGECIHLTDKARQIEPFRAARSNPRLSWPSYLQFENPETREQGMLLSLPGSEHVPFEFNKTQVAEYYAKRGV